MLKTQEVCGICGLPVNKKLRPPDPLSPSVDHIIPLDKGGHPSDLSNLQLAHRWCNRQKSNKLFLENAKAKPESKTEVNNDDLPLSLDWTKFRVQG